MLKKITWTQRAQIGKLFGFLWDENGLTENKVIFHKIGNVILYGPEDSFKNIRWREFMAAEKYVQAYRKTGNPDMITYLATVLYRPRRADYNPESPDYQGDIREDFNPNTMLRRVLLVKAWPPEVHMAIFFYYLGCRKELQQDYPYVFGTADLPEEGKNEADETEDKAEPEAEEEEEDFDWLDFLSHLPADKFGTLLQIENLEIHPVLYLANRMMKESQLRELQQRMKNRAK